MSYRILEYDSLLKPYEGDIELRMKNYAAKKSELLSRCPSLSDFANAHEYFGFHRSSGGWYYREWAPAADSMFLMGDMNAWDPS